MNPEAKLAVRCRPGNANHHLWNNNGTFWCHVTVHLSDFTKERLRLSLETGDVHQARRLRDSLFALFGCAVQSEAVAAGGAGRAKPDKQAAPLLMEHASRTTLNDLNRFCVGCR